MLTWHGHLLVWSVSAEAERAKAIKRNKKTFFICVGQLLVSAAPRGAVLSEWLVNEEAVFPICRREARRKRETADVITDFDTRQKNKPAASYSRTGESRTTLGDGALNFRVRNGNGCDNSSMATGKKPFGWELKRITTRETRRSHLQVKSKIS